MTIHSVLYESFKNKCLHYQLTPLPEDTYLTLREEFYRKLPNNGWWRGTRDHLKSCYDNKKPLTVQGLRRYIEFLI